MESLIEGLVFSIMATATAMTGGIVANPGETISTPSSYASVEIRNDINTSSGTSRTVITTEDDQGVRTETRLKNIPPQGFSETVRATSSVFASTTPTIKSTGFVHRILRGVSRVWGNIGWFLRF